MKTIEISGYSDDNVCVRGGGLTDEWGSYNEASIVVLSTGDRFSVEYGGEGTWRVEHVHVTGLVTVAIERCEHGAEDPDPYTDKAAVTGPIEWVDCWHGWPPPRDQLLDRISDLDLRDRDDASLLAVYSSLTGRAVGP